MSVCAPAVINVGVGAGSEQSVPASISIQSANALFLHTASKEGLRVIAQGMERAVRDAHSSGEML
jgi:hypothetical protein